MKTRSWNTAQFGKHTKGTRGAEKKGWKDLLRALNREATSGEGFADFYFLRRIRGAFVIGTKHHKTEENTAQKQNQIGARGWLSQLSV